MWSHPFVERLIGTIRREYLDRTLFWTTIDLEMKLLDFQHYFNGNRAHAGLDGRTPEPSVDTGHLPASFSSYRWQPHCRRLYQTPIESLPKQMITTLKPAHQSKSWWCFGFLSKDARR